MVELLYYCICNLLINVMYKYSFILYVPRLIIEIYLCGILLEMYQHI